MRSGLLASRFNDEEAGGVSPGRQRWDSPERGGQQWGAGAPRAGSPDGRQAGGGVFPGGQGGRWGSPDGRVAGGGAGAGGWGSMNAPALDGRGRSATRPAMQLQYPPSSSRN